MLHPSDLRRRPRCIVGLLLAFGIDVLRPVVQPVAHVHPGGERPHVHVGDALMDRGVARSLLYGARLATRVAPARGKPALATATASCLHVHLFRPAHVTHVAPLAPSTVVARHRARFTAPRPSEHPATTRPALARGPPAALA